MNYGKRKLPSSDYAASSAETNVGSSTETMKDEFVKRKFRNLNEKKRRDQFNMLINELAAMVSSDGKRKDKTGVLEQTMQFLRNHKESETSLHENVSYSWKPSFLSHDEFTFLILEAMNCVILALDHLGTIKYMSENANGILGLSQDLVTKGRQLQDLLTDDSVVRRLVSSSPEDCSQLFSVETLIRSDTGNEEVCKFQPVTVFSVPEGEPEIKMEWSPHLYNCVLQATTPAMSCEYAASADSAFLGIYSLDWKILHLEDKAATVLGYQPHELLGTSGYNYYHPEDIDYIASAHKKLLKSGTCETSPYRMSTRGQGWVWLQSCMHICYDQWQGKPVKINCMHTVPSKAAIDSHKASKGPLQQTESAPVIKKSRLREPLTSTVTQSESIKHADVYSFNLARTINKDREQRFGQQLPKTLPSTLFTKSEPTLMPPAHLNPDQQRLHTQLQAKYSTLKANLDRQSDDLSRLFHQLNVAAAASQSTSEYLSREDDSNHTLGAAATGDVGPNKSETRDFSCSWLL